MTDVSSKPQASARPTRVRHMVLWLTVAAYMITYVDRVAISAAIPTIQKEMGLTTITVGWVLAAFQFSYAIFQIPGGWLGDRFGPRKALTAIVTWWSAFTAATALAWSAGSLIVFRFLFGMGEAGAFPIATRSLSRWMLPSERGFAQGITHAGSRLGGALTPVLVVYLIAHFGWRAPFVAFALVGLLWAAIWFWFYRDTPAAHRMVNQAERELIETSLGRRQAAGKPSVPWRQILRHPQTWLLTVMYAFYGYNIGIYLSWFPKYLSDAHDVSLKTMGIYASLPLMAGVAGDVIGGWLSDVICARTGNLRFARRAVAVTGFLVAALSMIAACLSTGTPIVAVLWFCAAVFGLELTVGVSWAVALDIGDEFAGSVSAVMNTGGNLGATVAAAATGYIVTAFGWNPAFYVLAALSVAAALLFLRIDATQRVYAAT